MNPFTESTVARPLSEPRRQAANDAASHNEKPPPKAAESGAPALPPNASNRRRAARTPRGPRFARRSVTNVARKKTDGTEKRSLDTHAPRINNTEGIHKDNELSSHASRRRYALWRGGAAKLSYRCRSAVGILTGAVLALGVSAAWAVNVNSAGAQELETITGIGPKTAQTIIDERTRGGSFESFEDLAERVKGIGPKKAKSLQAAGLTVGAGGAAPKAPVPAVQRKADK